MASICFIDRIDAPLKEGVVRCECISNVEDMRITERLACSEWHKPVEPMGVSRIEIVSQDVDCFIASQWY